MMSAPLNKPLASDRAAGSRNAGSSTPRFRPASIAGPREFGFTLAEILIVVVIIGILASFVLPRFFGKTEEARLTATRMQITGLATALRSYNMDYGKFPTTDQGLAALLIKDAENRGPYLENTRQLPKDPWGGAYRYLAPGEHNPDYDLWSPGPDGTSGTEDDVGNWQ